jgi:NADH-quinone oxidoreductase subunit N
MYFKPGEEEFDWFSISAPVALALVVSSAGSLILGIIPSLLLQFAQQAVKLI